MGGFERGRRSPEWRAAQQLKGQERSQRLRALRHEHGLSPNAARRVAFDHWQASHWMGQVFGSRVALAIASETWTQVKKWMLGQTERPRFKPACDEHVCWGNDNNATLHLKDGRVRWTSATKRKNLDLRVARDWRPGRASGSCTWTDAGWCAWGSNASGCAAARAARHHPARTFTALRMRREDRQAALAAPPCL